jgi:hypothetical protein
VVSLLRVNLLKVIVASIIRGAFSISDGFSVMVSTFSQRLMRRRCCTVLLEIDDGAIDELNFRIDEWMNGKINE